LVLFPPDSVPKFNNFTMEALLLTFTRYWSRTNYRHFFLIFVKIISMYGSSIYPFKRLIILNVTDRQIHSFTSLTEVGLFKVILVGTGVQLKLRKHPNAYIAIK
jgi:hypothetical protein